MNILMVTNTYLPHVGGVARSVQTFTEEFRRLGHNVLVLAPEFPNTPTGEEGVIRVPAIQQFNGSDFSVRLPLSNEIWERILAFRPEIVHSHHPFLLGYTALRIADRQNVPLVFTHHTMYEQYTHYVPGDSAALKAFAIELATGYANLAHAVVAPSESVKNILESRGVHSEIYVVPTGIDTAHFQRGDGSRVRTALGIPTDSFILGHVGRLAQEKNLPFIVQCATRFMKSQEKSHLLVVGDGPLRESLERGFRRSSLKERVHFVGSKSGTDLADHYAAMDLFLFSSVSETQGMVLVEAMASGAPVVAVDAPGAREVVDDRKNGRLLAALDENTYQAAIEWIYQLEIPEKEKLRSAARATADKFSQEASASTLLAAYKHLLTEGSRPVDADIDDSAWLLTLRRIETEWNLLTAESKSLRRAIRRMRIFQIAPLRRLIALFRFVGSSVARAEWTVRLLNLKTCDSTSEDRGVLMIQVDGLSYSAFQIALRDGKFPFVRSLLKRRGNNLVPFYSGLPSTTPAVQGEIFYGRKSAVPAFAFLPPGEDKISRMMDFATASKVEIALKAEAPGLLEGGSTYSDIYGGGAEETHFCPGTFDWKKTLQHIRPFKALGFIISHCFAILVTILSLILELFLAIVDCVSGAMRGERLLYELAFIPSRLAVVILIREYIAARASLDLVRGLPIVHVNFLGYDEHSHRRGPKSHFAFWTIKGIDRAIQRLCTAAARSGRRNYAVWIYSDHGQEAVTSFETEQKRTIVDALREVFAQTTIKISRKGRHVVLRERASGGGPRTQHETSSDLDPFLVAASGPLGHVYVKDELIGEDKHTLAKRMVAVGIPIVFFDDAGTIFAYNASGKFRLPEQTAQVLGAHHPFLKEITSDLATLCRHPWAGTFVISGWRPEGPPLTFPIEGGAHGGPGADETRGFLIPPHPTTKQHFRPNDLRMDVNRFLGRDVPKKKPANAISAENIPKRART